MPPWSANHKMRQDMVVGVNCLVHAGTECSLTCRKAQAHWESSFVPLTASHVSVQNGCELPHCAFCQMRIKGAASFEILM
jgi:hypothetical protein